MSVRYSTLRMLPTWQLNRRIEEAWTLIEEKRLRGEETAHLEDHWLRMVAEYENRRHDEQEHANAN